MKKSAFFVVLSVIALLLLPSALWATKTLDNLQAAFNGESNAHARYVAFAAKADQDGYKQAAVLFRAAARAEEIHAANHAVVIKKLGATPQAKIEKPDVKSTAENLKAAVKGEEYERDVMYPEFIKVARGERNTDALTSFNYAKTAEAEHASLYKNAGENLPKMKTAGVKYYVCTICGYTTTKIDFEKCPACFNPKEKYVPVA
ncbi:MAG TPA: rubrerythrin family protein [Terriglobales bacterium]|nr:rubrerythrin family protein [Terriglobales bacterium]